MVAARSAMMMVVVGGLLLVVMLSSLTEVVRGQHHDHGHIRIPAANSKPRLLDPAASGSRRFDGHGGLSAGASSRLLFDYPEPQRSDILDYLWKPNFGAGLTMCKIEIGGDGQSTNGAEASHMHTRRDLNYDRGYEYWLAGEAKKRNPNVTVYGLSWAAPGWINNGTNWNVFAGRPSCPSPAHCAYFSSDMIQYQVNFVHGAQTHGIHVDFIGIWNERPWGTASYVKSLRHALDGAGFHLTQIVGSDGSVGRDEVAAMQADPAFSAAVPILGLHYPCARTVPSSVWVLPGKPKVVWSSEDNSGISGNWAGGGAWGRSLLQNVIKANATSTISWSTIWAAPEPWMYLGSGLGPSAWEP
jgi:galactosylceramidase